MLPFHSNSTRRKFMGRLGCFALASLPARQGLFCAPAFSEGSPKTPESIPVVVKDRAPLFSRSFYFLPQGSIQPKGWLKSQLEIQANGLGGHLDETWADVGPQSGWLGGKGESWERGPYFVDGLIPLAWQLEDARLKAKAQRFMEWTLEHQAPNGMIGPSTNNDWWPRIVMLKALTQYQEFTGDARVIPVMDRYFRYQLSELPKRGLRDWGRFRWQDELLSVVWLYNRTGSAYLLDLARLLHQQGYDWVAQYADFKYTQKMTSDALKLDQGGGLKDLALSTHGVNNGQAIKTGPVWSLVSGMETDRAAAARMIAELDQYHGLPNHMFSCDEHLAGRNPSQGSELCTVVESMFSLEQALAISGDPLLGDRLEQLAFNALPGAFNDDMWAHQYNQEPNQVECSLHRKPWTTDGPESNLYGLEPNFGCCTANFHQGWPKFAASLLMLSGAPETDAQDGLAAVAYAPCEARVRVRGIPVRVVEETDYPFRGAINFVVDPASPVKFPFRFRIPGWAAGGTIRVNGELVASPQAGTFAAIERTWKPGDRIEIALPMTPRVSTGFDQSVSVERGPLVFSYGIGESWVKLRDRGMTADWQVFPSTQWNYALNVHASAAYEEIAVEEAEVGSNPFAKSGAPVKLRVKARKLDAWVAEDGVAAPPPVSPVQSGEQDETIPLVPYAAAKLRITSFPRCQL